jgi:hypothetical protein
MYTGRDLFVSESLYYPSAARVTMRPMTLSLELDFQARVARMADNSAFALLLKNASGDVESVPVSHSYCYFSLCVR